MTKWTTMQDKALSSRGNLLISASAGSGKTTVMVQKIADYLFASESADIGKLVVITFTKAIAEEMKQKLSDKLYEKLRAATDERERERIRKQINGIPVSNISTIDSFCAEIFKRYFEVIEKDPLVSVIDQGEADAMFAEAREEVLEQYLESHDKEFFELVDKFTARREIDRLRKAIDDIHKFLAVQSDADAFIFRALTMLGGKVEECETSHYILKHYRRKAARLAGLCETEYTTLNCFSTDQKIFSAFSDMLCICRDMLLNITHAKDIANLFAIAALSEKQKTNHLRIRSNMEDDEQSALRHAKTVISAANEFIEETHNRFGGSFKDALNAEKESRKAVTKLFDIACKVDDAYRKAKDREKRADFADIEHYALQILNNESVAEEMRNGIDSIFIDEYQDTNYLQESIIARISRGNVFMVGDVKQSIYKFRFAEPAIFLDKKDRYEATKEGLNLHFNENFRSSEEVLRFINMVFDEVMVYDLGGIDYRKDARLIYGPDKKVKKQNDFPDAEVAFFENEREDTEAYPAYYSVTNGPRYSEKPSSEALYIADRIQAMAGKAYIYDAKSDNYRLCRYSDMAILFRARSSGADIIAELRRRNIPFEAEGFHEKGNTSPTELLICFAKLLDNDRQDFPLTAVMLSYFGKLNDKELLEIRSATPKGYFWESVKAYKGNKSIENKIQKLFGLLRKYRRLSAFLSMRELLDRLISETGYDGYLLSLGDNQIRRVNAFVFSLTEKENASTLKAFLHFCGCAEEESVTASVADDCVTLTTVHKSKGLEYPVVFLPCAEYSPKGAQNSGDIILEDNSGTTIKKRKKMMDSGMIALDVKLGIAIMHINDEGRKTDTLSTVALKLKQENDRKSEQIRLLYVAMTRARQHLFISGKPSSKTCLFPDEPNSFAGWIAYAKSHNNNLNRYFVNSKPQEPEITEDKHTYYPMEAKPVLLEKEYPHMASTKLSCKYSVSSLGKKKEDPDTLPAYTLDYQNDSHTDNILLGTAYHAILQYANFTRNTPEEVNLQIKHLLDTKMIESLPHGFDYAVMHKAFANPRFAFLSLGKCYREQPFMLYVPASKVIDTESNDSVLVQGVIDFLSVGKEAVLIDYKYTRAPLDIVRARYQKQLDIYTLAAEKALGIRIDRREIYLIGRDEFVLL